MTTSLETPSNWPALYAARGTETQDFEFRPRFTGDVLLEGDTRVLLLQHPCAMRRGPSLVERLLVGHVTKQNGKPPSDWGSGHFKKAFLPEMLDGEHYAVMFDEIDIWSAERVAEAERQVISSLYGVNLLMQRWMYHNTRVEVPTGRFNDSTNGPFDEADLVGEILTELDLGGIDVEGAVERVDGWLDGAEADGEPSRRARLNDAQQRSSVRRSARNMVRDWLDSEAI